MEQVCRSDSPDWLVQRRQGLGGSDMAAILGLSRWRGPVSVWLDKLGSVEPEAPSDAQVLGHYMEPIIQRLVVRRYPDWSIRRFPYLVRHSTYPHVLGTPDRRAKRPGRPGWGILELKSYGAWAQDEFRDGVSPEVYCQVQTYCGITGYRWGAVAAVVNQRLHVFEIPADPEFQTRMFELAEAWWQRHIVEQVPPPVEPPDYAVFTRLAVAESPPEEEPWAGDWAAVLTEYTEARALRKTADARWEAATAAVKRLLLDNQGRLRAHVRCGSYQVTAKPVTVKAHWVAEHTDTRVTVRELKTPKE